MKTKKLSNKLGLNKETIARIGHDELTLIKGGYVTGTCPERCQTDEAHCSAAGCIPASTTTGVPIYC